MGVVSTCGDFVRENIARCFYAGLDDEDVVCAGVVPEKGHLVS